MNEIIEQIQLHRSIRKYKEDAVPKEMLEQILLSAQKASTSSNVQAYSVIAITDPSLKRQLAELAGGQQYVEQCPVLLVWCADLYRHSLICEQADTEMHAGTMENFLVATIDAALAAQNAAIAAESMGLGICYIGGLRNDIQQVTQLLQLPQLVYPLFGMCVGFPDHDPGQRPRLPLNAVLHHEVYSSKGKMEAMEEYDQQLRDYYIKRTQGKRDSTWSEEIVNKFRRPARRELYSYLKKQGFIQES